MDSESGKSRRPGTDGSPWRQLICLWLALLPGLLSAQSVPLLRAQQNFENAKASGNVAEALRDGDEAVRISESGADQENLLGLLRSLGDFAAQSGEDAVAIRYYQRALGLEEVQLGVNHPDLVPLLTTLTDLRLKAKQYPEAAALEQRTLAIEREAYGDRHENVTATVAKLQNLYRLTNDTVAASQLEALLAPAPAASTRGNLPAPGTISTKSARYNSANGFATVRVFYGTNRAPSGEVKPALYYGRARGDLQYGYLDVTIPKTHKEAELETQPRWADYVYDVSQMRARYVLLDKVTPLRKDVFLQTLRQQVKNSPSKDVFIFVHGFNSTFEDAARRAAQLVYDLDFDGTPMLYSWPSQGSATAYAVDEASVGISGRKMAEFLENVVTQSGAERIHLLAHSMGNRALIEALQTYLAKKSPENRQHIFGQVVFTAPDVDRDYFMDAIGSIRGAADRVTLYASNNDYALRSSQYLHGAPRAGTAGEFIIREAGLDSIDMSAVPADVLGHTYFAANAGAIFDIFRLLWRGDAPPQRCGMSGRSSAGPLSVWVFNADVCKGDDLLEAGVMLKRFGDLARQKVVANLAALTDPSQKQQWSLILKRLDVLLPSVNAQSGGTIK
jgi:esterase/lipase superfamily enzyme